MLKDIVTKAELLQVGIVSAPNLFPWEILLVQKLEIKLTSTNILYQF